MTVYLASTSPRRRQLLGEILDDFVRISPETEEKEYPFFTPKEKCIRRCKDKCVAAINHIKEKDMVIIASDTVVDFHGNTLDKPENEAAAYKMISDLSDNFHLVHTAVSVYKSGTMYTFCDTASVHFRHIPRDVITRYVKEDTAYDKRGGYGIQTDFGKKYIDKTEGDYYTVVGLPVQKLKNLLTFLNIL